jgi:hypothetical protein
MILRTAGLTKEGRLSCLVARYNPLISASRSAFYKPIDSAAHGVYAYTKER